MSPEQLRGEPIDPRSDIFSLGCVLFEMLSGSAPFARQTPTSTVAAILADAGWKYLSSGAWTDDIDVATERATRINYW